VCIRRGAVALRDPACRLMRPLMLQRFIVRIIFMVPVYAVSSFCSLIFPHGAIYFDTVRIWCVPASLLAAPPRETACAHPDGEILSVSAAQACCSSSRSGADVCHRVAPRSYEAFVIYNFLSLCLSYVGGPGAVEVQMNGYLLMPSLWNCTCCLPPQVRTVNHVLLCFEGRRLKCGSYRRKLPSPTVACLWYVLPFRCAKTVALPVQMVDGLFVRRCKQGAIQFVLLMPILGILSTVLYATGYYHPGDWGASSSCASDPVENG